MKIEEYEQLRHLLQEFRDELHLNYSHLDNLEIHETNRQVVERRGRMVDLQSNISACNQLLETLEE